MDVEPDDLTFLDSGPYALYSSAVSIALTQAFEAPSILPQALAAAETSTGAQAPTQALQARDDRNSAVSWVTVSPTSTCH